MKKSLFALLIMASALAWAKPKPADYTLTAHVRSSRLGQECESVLGRTDCSGKLHLIVVINERQYELAGYYDYLLVLGDYKARLVPEDTSTSDNPPAAYDYRRKYEFLFPDGKTRKYDVVGETEYFEGRGSR
jgi:hypothetical protein